MLKEYFLSRGITIKNTHLLPDYYAHSGIILGRVLIETDKGKAYIAYLNENNEVKFHLNGGV